MYRGLATLSVLALARGGSRRVAVVRDGVSFKVAEAVGGGDELAWGEYKDGNSQDGWNELAITATPPTSSTADWLVSRFSMGYLEGQLTCKEINLFYPNFYNDLFGSGNEPGAATVTFMKAQYEWSKAQAEAQFDSDEYWLAQLGTVRQLEGLFKGFVESDCQAQAVKSSFRWDSLTAPTFEQFLLINGWGDMYQIALKFRMPDKDGDLTPAPLAERRYGFGQRVKMQRCSSLVKILPENKDVLFAHNTWDGFGSLGPRIFKHFSFPFPSLQMGTSGLYDVHFSSSPLLLSSVDDFFVLNSPRANLAVTETTNSLYNVRLLDLVVPESLLSWQRATAANFLAKSGSEWPTLFARYASGTYTNQWMVLDLSLFIPGKALPAGFFSVLEEVPGLVVQQDQTATLQKQTFWSSYNSPFYPEIQKESGYKALCLSGASEACYDKAPRAMLFAEYQGGVRDLAGMQALMQYNNYTQDAASAGDSCQAIACRGDLEPAASKAFAGGALDAKVGSAVESRAVSGKAYAPAVYAILGPSTSSGSLPPFCWSAFEDKVKSQGKNTSYSHQGQPDCFNYAWTVFGGN